MQSTPTRFIRGLSSVLLALAFGACATKAPPAPVTAQAPQAQAPVAPPTATINQTATAAAPCELEHVYFDFDSSDLDDRAKETLARDQRCAQQKGATTLRVVGMTDPRGTEEYNLALGDRRARNAARYLSALGAPEPEASSLGSEMAKGDDEIGWANDRRTEVQLK